jgi:hypothetical protein
VSQTNARIAMTHKSYGSVVRSSRQKERAVERAAQPARRRQGFLVERQIRVVMRLATDRTESTRITHRIAAILFVNAPIMNSTIRSGRFHEADLALLDAGTPHARARSSS